MSPGDQKTKTLFIVNPNSGIGREKAIEDKLEKHLDPSTFDYTVCYTQKPGHATELSRQGKNEGYRLIVAVGGDGTVNEVARPLIGSDVILGLIPAGSGNGLARHLKIPVDTVQAIGQLNRMKTKKIDTVKVNDQVFLSIAGVGFDAFVAKKFARQRHRGFFKYLQIAIWEYFGFRPQKFRMVVDGKKIKRKALFISLANSDQFGYNTSIAPNARIDDGMIDICIMKKIPLWKTFFLAPLLFLRKIDRSPYVEIFRAREVDLKQKKEYINLDGESVRMSKRLHVRVIPQSLNIMVS